MSSQVKQRTKYKIPEAKNTAWVASQKWLFNITGLTYLCAHRRSSCSWSLSSPPSKKVLLITYGFSININSCSPQLIEEVHLMILRAGMGDFLVSTHFHHFFARGGSTLFSSVPLFKATFPGVPLPRIHPKCSLTASPAQKSITYSSIILTK